MSAALTRLVILLAALAPLACQAGAPPFSGRPRIATAVTRLKPKSPVPVQPAASTPPASSAPAPSLEPPPAPIRPPGGAPGDTPAADASPALELVVGAQPADTWQAGPALQRPRAGLTAAVLAGDLVALEGENSPSLERFTSGELAWRLDASYDLATATGGGATLRHGRALQALGVAADALYAAGGSNGLGALDAVVRYEASGLIGQNPLLTTPVKAAAGGLVGDTLVVAGGVGADGAIASAVQRMNVANGVVEAGAAMPVPVAGAASAMVGAKLYVLGGYTLTDGAPSPVTTVQIYDVTANTWRRTGDGAANAPAALATARHSAAAAALSGKIYLAGGVGANGQPVEAMAVYTIASNTWKAGAPMLTPRALLALAAFEGRLWALGGYDATCRALASVEVYQP